jgi:hypothetical protein
MAERLHICLPYLPHPLPCRTRFYLALLPTTSPPFCPCPPPSGLRGRPRGVLAAAGALPAQQDARDERLVEEVGGVVEEVRLVEEVNGVVAVAQGCAGAGLLGCAACRCLRASATQA